MSRATKLASLFIPFLATGLTTFASEGGISPKAGSLHGIITNSMITSWVVAAVFIIIVRLAIKKPTLVPSRAQAIMENLVQGVLDLTAPIVGNKVARYTLPLLIGLFTYILIQNWSGLFPGVGTVYVAGSNHQWLEFVRPGNADLNTTIALAVVSMVCWFYFIMRYAGPALFFQDLFGNKADKNDVPAIIYYPLFIIFFAVGMIEIISIIFRPVSLSFRLYGNVFGGENLIHAMSGIFPWVLPIPFYFLELLIGFVQALVFTLLVAVYIGLICNHGDEHPEIEGHSPQAH